VQQREVEAEQQTALAELIELALQIALERQAVPERTVARELESELVLKMAQQHKK